MQQEIIAHEILQLIIRKKPLWKWEQKCIYADGIDNTFMRIVFFDENRKKVGSTCFQLETGIVQFSTTTNDCSPTTLVDFLLDILAKTKTYPVSVERE
ncbi:hypothetical protein [Bernardetia sp.]|uniref:hypothetical protein n=1 Tax=Bernardetia sp. TaxID=1937974 RepID=UPI0025B86106|nr:hypothetical protein [Bernardetia sp.]